MSKQMAKDNTPNLDAIISELKTSLDAGVELGNFKFKELSYDQQRRLLNSNTSPAEYPAVVGNLLNDFIAECVEYTDDIVDVRKTVTIIQKPFLLNKLRELNFGTSHKENGIEYEMYKVKEEDFDITVEPKTIERAGLTINLRVPTLAVDTHFNKILVSALSNYKGKRAANITEIESGELLLKYQLYELMKYIESFEFNGQKFDFTDMLPRSCVDFMNVLKAPIVKEIAKYHNEIQNASKKAITFYGISSDDTLELPNYIEFFILDMDQDLESVSV